MLRKLVTYSEREEIKMKKLRVGIVGCGGIANQKHFPALKSQSELCEMVAFCDIIEERAKKACEEYGAEGARYYTDYTELLKDESIDAVHVCTPNPDKPEKFFCISSKFQVQ